MRIVKTYFYSHLAHLDLAKLKDEGIDAFIKDDNIVTMNIAYAQAVGGIKIMVNDEDYERASEALNANEYEELKNEFNEIELGLQNKCPSCGSIKIYQKGSWLSLIGFLIFFPISFKQKKYMCTDCGNNWKDENAN